MNCSIYLCENLMKTGGLCSKHAAAEYRKKEPLYNLWLAMKQRCYNKNGKGYKFYGGRGIIVCDRWRHNFQIFKLDMGPRPTYKHTLDRIDNNGNYEPGNCRWATQYEQNLNQRIRCDNKLGIRGVLYDKMRAKYRVHIVKDGKQKFLGRYETLDEAVTARKRGELEVFGKELG